MQRSLWQYQARFEPPQIPGAETVFAPTVTQATPQRNFRQRGIAYGLLVAAAPFLFFDPEPIAAAAFTDQIEQAISEPQPQIESQLHLLPSLFFNSQPLPPLTAQTQRPLEQPDRTPPPIAPWAPAFFFQEAPAFTAQTEQAVFDPPPPEASRLHAAPSFFFQEDQGFTTQPEQALSQPLFEEPRRLQAAPSFFFDPEPRVFTDQPLQAISEPLRQVPSRVHGYPGFFFDSEPIAVAFTDQIEQAISQPLVIEPHRVTSESLFFDPFPRPFDQQIEPALSEPLAVDDRRYLAPGFFFDPEPVAAAFTDQIEQAIFGPIFAVQRPVSDPHFFFDTEPIVGAFTDQIEQAISQPLILVPSRLHAYPGFFEAVSQDAETIFVPGWYQPASEPARNFRLHLRQYQTLVALAPSFIYEGEPITGPTFTAFIPVTRNRSGPLFQVVIECVMWTNNAAFPVFARLFNITDGGTVSGSQISTAATSAARVRSAAFSLPSAGMGAKEYRIEFGGTAGVGATYTCHSGDWFPA